MLNSFKGLFIFVTSCSKFYFAAAQLVEARRYKPESRAFDSRWFQWNFSLK
jgi:hypothetical protein